MNKENASKLWKIIQEAGDYLVGQLPDHPNHPKGRNPYAHVALEVKNHFGMTYKDIPDEQYEEVVKYIEFLKEKFSENSRSRKPSIWISGFSEETVLNPWETILSKVVHLGKRCRTV